MLKVRLNTSVSVLLVAAAFMSCGKKKDSKNDSKSGGTVAPRILVGGQRAMNAVGAFSSILDVIEKPFGSAMFGAATAGQTTSVSLKSLKYYVQSIQICKDIARQGSGYSGTTGCISIYSNADATQQAYQDYDISTAMADTSEDHWIDFMSATSRAKLTANPVTLTSDAVGSYNYGLINFIKAIKINAEFVLDGQTKLYTKTPTAAEIINDTADSFGKKQHLTFDTTDPTTGPSGEMTVMNNNGGTIFNFLSPLTITEADIDNKTGFKVDFVFNPDNYAGAWRGDGTNCSGGIAPKICGDYDIPMGKLAPVPHKDGETISKEAYLVSNFTTSGDLRIELYYNNSDSKKAIMGVDRSIVAKTGATGTRDMGTPYLYRASEDAAGVVTFYDYNSATNQIDRVSVQGLTRRASGKATFPCPGQGAFGGICQSSSESKEMSYTFVGTEAVSQP